LAATSLPKKLETACAVSCAVLGSTAIKLCSLLLLESTGKYFLSRTNKFRELNNF
jgi:hypothetical protein